MESLSKIYTLSVDDLIGKIKSLVSIEDSNVTLEASNRPPMRFDEPLFIIKLDCNFKEIDESRYQL